jgi:RimJ/RimL family protein N-acetyltransferase
MRVACAHHLSRREIIMALLALESEHFTLRSLTTEDARLDWGDWLADPATAAAVNAVPRLLTPAEREAYVARMDNHTAFLLGVFEKSSGTLVGIWTIYVDPVHREYLLSVMSAPQYGRNQGALTETREPIYRHFFNVIGLEAARISVMASNTYVLERLKRQPWTLEHRSHTRAAGTQEALAEVCHFRMTKSAWEEFHRAKAS